MGRCLHIDFETRSVVDLKACGVHVYAESADTSVLCMAWGFTAADVQLWHPALPFPSAVANWVAKGGEVGAHNAAFELAIWNGILRRDVPGLPALTIEQANCTQARAGAVGLPQSLDALAKFLRLTARKDDAGKKVMLRLSKPRGYTSAGMALWHDDAASLATLYEYCRQDVRVEMAVDAAIPQLTTRERAVWCMDQRINNRGICIDTASVARAQIEADAIQAQHDAAIKDATWGFATTAHQADRLQTALAVQGVVLDDLTAETVKAALLMPDLPDNAKRILTARQGGSQSSAKKLAPMLRGSCRDGRARGLLAYYGAHTGRWSGRRVQPQNMPRLTMEQEAIDAAFDRLADGTFGVQPDRERLLKNMLRGMLTASPGNVLVAADFANIEGRVLAWLAGEAWKTAAFAAYDAGTGPDLYVLAYARAFDVSVADVTKAQRQIGKVMELALGYQGGLGAFVSMAAAYGVRVLPDGVAKTRPSDLWESEVRVFVKAWRTAHPTIAGVPDQRGSFSGGLWHDIEDAAHRAITTGLPVTCGRVSFVMMRGVLYCRLPSGRSLAYPNAHIGRATKWADTDDEYKLMCAAHKVAGLPKPIRERIDAGRDAIIYQGSTPFPKTLYGGLIVENIVQAIARDLLVSAMLTLDAGGYPIVLHVHDETVCDLPDNTELERHIETMRSVMTTVPNWAHGLPIAVSINTNKRYGK